MIGGRKRRTEGVRRGIQPPAGVLLGLLLALSACATQARRNPLYDREILPLTDFRGVVRSEATLNLLPALDQRTRDADFGREAEDLSSIPATELLHQYLRREILSAGILADVISGEQLEADLVMRVSLYQFSGIANDDLPTRTGHGWVEFGAVIERSSDGAVLLQRRYTHRSSESHVLIGEPDPLELACRSLKETVLEFLIDLSRVDPRGPADSLPTSN